jgi:DNA-binding protein Fis
MEESHRSVAKKQIARLIGGSTNPTYVLSDENVIVFANDALANHFDLPIDDLIGLVCESIPQDGSPLPKIASALAVPIDWARQSVKLMPAAIKALSHIESQQPPTHRWLRCLIPLEPESNGCVLCVFYLRPGESQEIECDEVASNVQQWLRDARTSHAHLDRLWFLQGGHPKAKRALEQTQIAIATGYSTLIVGPLGAGQPWLADAIHAHRCKGANDQGVSDRPANNMTQTMIRIECPLMDAELLQSMFEGIERSLANRKCAVTVLLENMDVLSEDCFGMLTSFLDRHPSLQRIGTCSSTNMESLETNPSWRRLMVQASTIRIEIPALAERIRDLRVLVAAWMQSNANPSKAALEHSGDFVDMLSAYPWPDGIEEFSGALRLAVESLVDANRLEVQHLPVNVRTCLSHAQHETTNESIDLDSILEDVEKTMILRAIDRFPQNKTAAAKLLNISRARLLRRLQQWGIAADPDAKEVDTKDTDFKDTVIKDTVIKDNEEDQPIFKEVK